MASTPNVYQQRLSGLWTPEPVGSETRGEYVNLGCAVVQAPNSATLNPTQAQLERVTVDLTAPAAASVNPVSMVAVYTWVPLPYPKHWQTVQSIAILNLGDDPLWVRFRQDESYQTFAGSPPARVDTSTPAGMLALAPKGGHFAAVQVPLIPDFAPAVFASTILDLTRCDVASTTTSPCRLRFEATSYASNINMAPTPGPGGGE